MKYLLLLCLVLPACTTTTETTTYPDGRVVTTSMRQADHKTLRVLAGAGVDILSQAAAAEISRRAQEGR